MDDYCRVMRGLREEIYDLYKASPGGMLEFSCCAYVGKGAIAEVNHRGTRNILSNGNPDKILAFGRFHLPSSVIDIDVTGFMFAIIGEEAAKTELYDRVVPTLEQLGQRIPCESWTGMIPVVGSMQQWWASWLDYVYRLGIDQHRSVGYTSRHGLFGWEHPDADRSLQKPYDISTAVTTPGALTQWQRGKGSISHDLHLMWLSRDIRICTVHAIDLILATRDGQIGGNQVDQSASLASIEGESRVLALEDTTSRPREQLFKQEGDFQLAKSFGTTWDLLATTLKIGRNDTERMAKDLIRRGWIFGLRFALNENGNAIRGTLLVTPTPKLTPEKRAKLDSDITTRE